MKFSEWWDNYKWNAGLQQGAYDAYNEGFEEGHKRTVEERSDTSQGGGSHKCHLCGSEGFERSKHLAYGCSFCDGTEGGQQPGA
jgi:hypothetical protein